MADPTPDPNTRAPTSPLVGLLRTAVFAPAAIWLAAKAAALGVPIDADKITVALLAGAAFLGKTLRDKYAWAKWLPL